MANMCASLLHWYSEPLFIKPSLGNGKPGLIRGVASSEGFYYNHYAVFSPGGSLW